MNLTEIIQKAVGLMQAGRQAECVALCHKLLERVPGQPDALHLLAMAARNQGDAVAAERLFKQAIAAAPKRADILVNFANFLANQERQRAVSYTHLTLPTILLV